MAALKIVPIGTIAFQLCHDLKEVELQRDNDAATRNPDLGEIS